MVGEPFGLLEWILYDFLISVFIWSVLISKRSENVIPLNGAELLVTTTTKGDLQSHPDAPKALC